MTVDSLFFGQPKDLGDAHFSEFDTADIDRATGVMLSHYIGCLYPDVGSHCRPGSPEQREAFYQFYYRTQTARDEWTTIAKALRVHGLRIVPDTQEG